MNRYVSAKAIADLLGVSDDTVRRQAASGKIPSIRIGSTYRFEPEKVIRKLENQTPQPA